MDYNREIRTDNPMNASAIKDLEHELFFWTFRQNHIFLQESAIWNNSQISRVR